jgi:hypothetical protein
MTNHDDVPTPLPALVWAVIFCILLVAAVASACPYSLMASRITTGRVKRLPATPILASAMQGARLHTTHRAEGGPLRGQTGKTYAHSEPYRF